VIRAIAADGEVTTIGGTPGRVGLADGAAARFFNPKGVAVSQDGRIYIADLGNRSVRVGVAQ
jgi:hypothetical protein